MFGRVRKRRTGGLGRSVAPSATRPTPRTVLPKAPAVGWAGPVRLEARLAEAMVSSLDALSDMLGTPEVIEGLVEGGDWWAILELLDWPLWERTTMERVLPEIRSAIEGEGRQAFGEVRHGLQAQRAQAVRSGAAPPFVPPEEPGTPAAPSPRSGGFYATGRFNMTNPHALAFAERHAAELVREVGRNTRNAIRDAVVESFREGVTADVLARRLRSTVGLTARQAGWVENYRERLLRGGMDEDRVDVLTRRYYRKVRNRRAQTIARTEIMRASNLGRQLAWQSAADGGLLDANESVKEWITAPERSKYGPPCPSCLPMDGVKVQGLDGLFHLPGGKQISMPPAHPNAVLVADSFVPYGGLQEFVAARYDGPGITIVLASGQQATVGPNHPVFTDRGMVRAKALRPGDQVVYDRRIEGAMAGAEHDLVKVPSLEDATTTLLASSDHTLVPGAGHDFHGDRTFCEGDVHVVRPDGLLLPELDACGIEGLRYARLDRADPELLRLASEGAPLLDLVGVGDASAGSMRCGHASWPASPVVAAEATGSTGILVAPTVWATSPIVSVHEAPFTGWAVDASTVSGAYSVGGIVVSNCRCTAVVWPPEPPENWDPEYPFAQV